jgi:hypothetical protein
VGWIQTLLAIAPYAPTWHLTFPLPFQKGEKSVHFCPRPRFKPTTLTLIPLLERHHLTSPPKIRR